MRMPFLPVLPSLLSLVVVAACATNPTNDPTPMFAPMPMGEIALPRPLPQALETTHPVDIEHTWTDTHGRVRTVAFRCKYTTDDAHELLAAACVQTNLATAWENTFTTCRNADLDTVDGITACERRLQEQLTETLFPCADGDQLAQVSGIEWTLWLVR